MTAKPVAPNQQTQEEEVELKPVISAADEELPSTSVIPVPDTSSTPDSGQQPAIPHSEAFFREDSLPGLLKHNDDIVAPS